MMLTFTSSPKELFVRKIQVKMKRQWSVKWLIANTNKENKQRRQASSLVKYRLALIAMQYNLDFETKNSHSTFF